MEAFEQRMIVEKQELDEKLMRLVTFINGEKFLLLEGPHRNQLSAQVSAMTMYSNILADRLAALGVDSGLMVAPSGNQVSPIMQYFKYSHLPEKLQVVSSQVHTLAQSMNSILPDGPEKSAGLRKLLEAKDCFVRASL